MNELDDSKLRAQLTRRSHVRDADLSDGNHLSRAIAERLLVEHQDRGLRERLTQWAPRRRSWAVLAVGITAVAVIGTIALTPRTQPSPPGGTDRGVQVLSAAELSRLLGSETAAARITGHVVIADAGVEPATPPCPTRLATCPIGYVTGTNRTVLVYPDPGTEQSRTLGLTNPQVWGMAAPIAFRVRALDQVDLVGPLKPSNAARLVWTLPSFVSEAERLKGSQTEPDIVAGPPYIVDAWLIEPGGLAAICPPPPTTPPPAAAPFTCGSPSWLTPDEEQPTRAKPGQPIESWTVGVPSDGLRVPNGAWEVFALDPVTAGDPPLPVPRRALYLIQPLLVPLDATCFMCPAGGAAFITDRLDPVQVP